MTNDDSMTSGTLRIRFARSRDHRQRVSRRDYNHPSSAPKNYTLLQQDGYTGHNPSARNIKAGKKTTWLTHNPSARSHGT